MNEIKYKTIAVTLENNIKNNLYSEKLPPVRSLLVEFSVANPTMNKALKILTKKGLIIPSGPRGNIINKKSIIRPKTNIIGILGGGNSPDPDNSPMFNELKLKIEADGYKPLFMNVPDPDIFDDGNFWSSNWVDGYIFAYSTIKKELIHKLHRCNVPFVVANHLPPEWGSHCVDFNLEKTLRLFVQRLIKAGRRRIIFAYSGILLPSYADYAKQSWYNTLKEYRRECSGDLLYFPEYELDKNSLECAKKFTELKADALIILGLSPLVIESELAKTGRQINKDYSLCHRANKIIDNANQFSYAITYYKKLADVTWDLFKQVLENPELEAQHILVDDNIYLNAL